MTQYTLSWTHSCDKTGCGSETCESCGPVLHDRKLLRPSRIYVAGPMTGYEDHNYPAFDAARERLCTRYPNATIVTPCDLNRAAGYTAQRDGTITRADYCRLFRADIETLLLSDAIAVLPGWGASRGAKVEMALAQMLGLPVLDDCGAPLVVDKITTQLMWHDPYEPL